MNTTDLVSKSEDGTTSHNFQNEMPSQNTWTDEETEEEAMEDVLKYEDTLFPVSTDQQDGFSSDSSWDDEERDFNADADKTRKITHAEKIRTFKLRKKLDQLDSMRQQKDHDLLKAREELRACHMRIAELKRQQEVVEKQILEEQNSENIAAMFRLRALHKRLGIELQGEEELESQIAMAVKENEMEQCELEVQQRKFKHVLQEVQLNEEIIERQRNWEATQRLQREEAAQIRKLRSQKNISQHIKPLKEREMYHRRAVEEAQKSHKKAMLFLKETMTRVRQKEAAEEARSREEMEKKMQAILSLKNNIAQNKENLRIQQARDKAKALQQKEEEDHLRESLKAEGLDVTKYMYQQKRMQEFEKMKQLHEEQQRLGKLKIASKIVEEASLLEKRKKHQARNFLPSSRRSINRELGISHQTLQRYQECFLEDTVKEDCKPVRCSSSPVSEDESLAEENNNPDFSEWLSKRGDSEENLAEPEFKGLWEQPFKSEQLLKDKPFSKLFTSSKMDQEMLARALEKQSCGIIQKQIAAGKEFKGCAFKSKPDVIHFKDFEVGKSYRKKILLTNVSYSINFCKLLGISEHLQDFISVQFTPPGPMSAGMTCDLVVVFKPKINEDMFGEVKFLAQTGAFTVPVKCTIKKCELAVDINFIDFGTNVIGETISRTITLTNSGALGTQFHLVTTSSSGAIHLLTEPPTVGDLDTQDFECSEISFQESRSQKDELEIYSEKPSQTSMVKRDSDTSSRTQKIQEMPISTGEEILHEADPEIENESLMSEQPKTDRTEKLLVTHSEPVIVECDEIQIEAGNGRKGEIAPYGCIKLQVIFTPIVPGEVHMSFDIVFSDPNSKSIPIHVCGVASDMPVWVTRPNIDFKICMYDRLYQDSISVHSRSNISLQLTFEVCKELRNHMEILPKTGFIQAQSTFNAQLKFLPRQSLADDAESYFDKDTGVLEVPMIIHVADQTRAIPFAVHAVVTTSDLEFNKTVLDFGHCSLFHSVQFGIQITNHSLLPQDFGFVQLPQCIDIQPNDGFGTLLPLETFDLNVIFSPEIAKEYKFDLICKCLTNREFKLSCIGVGVHPPLELSHSLVQFRATAIYDASTVIIYVINSHTSLNELSHPASLVGKGEIAPVGPTAFEFAVPEHLDITVAPSVGTVMPGEKCLVRVTFRPKISDQAIKEEAVRMMLLAEEGKILQEKTEKDESNTLKAESESLPYSVTKKSTRQTSPVTPVQASKEKAVKTSGTPKSNSSQIPFESPKMEDIQKDSDEYAAAQASLIRSFKDSVSTCIISCFVGTIANPNKPGSIQYSSSNTLYMEVRCPAVKPPLIVISNQGRTSLNFGDVATGHTLKKRIRVQNISHETVELSSSLFNPCGPFMLMNALRPLLPGATHTLLISFTPMENKKYYEILEVQTKNAALNLNLSGKGICPVVICSVEDGVLDFGCILAKESTSCFFKLQNTSPVTTDVSMKLDSLSVRLLMEQQEIPVFLTPGKERNSPVGTQNYHGLSVFSVSPAEVTIEPGKTHDISVIFQPDHESLYYSDRLQVELGDKVAHVITLKGAARNCAMYITGGDPLDVPVESLVELPTREDAEKGEATDVIPVLLTLKTTQKEDTLVPLQREFVVGCLKSTQPTTKKNVEFSFDNVQSLQHKGFTVDPSRGTVEPGQKKSISVTWVPPNGHDQRYPVSASALLTLKGDITEIYKVNLIAIIVDA